MSHQVHCVVVGAGVVGLATARAISARLGAGSVYVLERHATIGTETSSRNSGVVHSGIYYPPFSWKARHCVEGRRLLLAYAKERAIPIKETGKLVVATDEVEVKKLVALRNNARANGVSMWKTKLLSSKEAQKLEPLVQCKAALYSGTTGIIDTQAYLQSLHADALEQGATFAFNCSVARIEKSEGEGFSLETSLGPIKCKWLVNACGLHAPALAARIPGFPASFLPKTFFAKGNYFRLKTGSGTSPFRHLVYPLPSQGGLGVHATSNMQGQVIFGPDVQWLAPPAVAFSQQPLGERKKDDDIFEWPLQQDGATTTTYSFSYDVDETRAASFYAAIRKYYPTLPDNSLVPDYAGIRPKLHGPFSSPSASDFVISASAMPNLINIFGIESPGLTSSLAIARNVNYLLTR